ncbi:MAG TPA: hypothetical protein VMW38_15755 [Terriglobia bacterium]|nr:hypothetical protein [Terriglobia bacterium]
MKGKFWLAAFAGIFLASEFGVGALPAKGPGGFRQFPHGLAVQSFSTGLSALGRSWFFTPNLMSFGRGFQSGFPFGGFNPLMKRVQYSTPFPYFGQYPGYGFSSGWESESTNSFVEEWLSRDPFEEPKSSGLDSSPILSKGMTEEEVVLRIGSPIQKTALAGVGVWKYSGFSLYFRGGTLNSLR